MLKQKICFNYYFNVTTIFWRRLQIEAYKVRNGKKKQKQTSSGDPVSAVDMHLMRQEKKKVPKF